MMRMKYGWLMFHCCSQTHQKKETTLPWLSNLVQGIIIRLEIGPHKKEAPVCLSLSCAIKMARKGGGRGNKMGTPFPSCFSTWHLQSWFLMVDRQIIITMPVVYLRRRVSFIFFEALLLSNQPIHMHAMLHHGWVNNAHTLTRLVCKELVKKDAEKIGDSKSWRKNQGKIFNQKNCEPKIRRKSFLGGAQKFSV